MHGNIAVKEAYDRTKVCQKFTPIEWGLPEFTLPSEH
jgi:hypothetical protein